MVLASILFIFVFVYFIIIYNKIIYFRNLSKQAESDIGVFLKKRKDLLEKLVEVVKGYSEFERTTLEGVVEARNLAMRQNLKNAGEFEGKIQESLKSLFAVAENYPVLKANENYLELQREITKVEEDLQKARRFYNGVVQSYNTYIQKFPNVILSKALKLKPLDYFDYEEA